MRLRGALIGLGQVAVHGHLPAWLERDDIEIVAGSDTCAARERVLESRAPGVRWYESVERLLQSEALDFVDICTPPASHAGLVRIALEHGLHVLCEKPLVCRRDELKDLAALADTMGRALYTVHNWHYAPLVQKITQLLRADAIGTVTECQWETLRTKPAGVGAAAAEHWRADPAVAGGGVLVDHGWHALYLLHRWVGLVPTRISARLETWRHTRWPVEDTARVRCQFPTATAELFFTWASDVRRNTLRLEGSRGTIWIEDDEVILMDSPAGEQRRWTCPPALSHGSYHPDWFQGVAEGFVSAVTGSLCEREVNLAEAGFCATAMAIAQESNRQGSAWLPMPEGSRDDRA